MGVRNLNTGTKSRTEFGMALEQSAKEILAHVKGDVRLPTRRIVLPDEVDVKRIRTKAGMSQAEFARAFCINPRTLQEWSKDGENPTQRPAPTSRLSPRTARWCWTHWRLELKELPLPRRILKARSASERDGDNTLLWNAERVASLGTAGNALSDKPVYRPQPSCFVHDEPLRLHLCHFNAMPTTHSSGFVNTAALLAGDRSTSY